MTANNFAANAAATYPAYQDIVNLLASYEKVFKGQAQGLAGYDNTSISKTCFYITSTASNGGLGGLGIGGGAGASNTYIGNSSVAAWVANGAMVLLCNTIYSSVAQT